MISNITRNRILNYLSQGKRFDERGLLDFRDIEIENEVSNKAEGSARVRIGETEVIAGVKMEVVEPYPDSQDAGVLITTAELLPLSSENFEPGPPKIEAIEIARLVDRAIRESGYIDFKKLCIKEGEKVWAVYIDIFSINDAGNIQDAAAMAALAALRNAKIPKYDEKEDKVDYHHKSGELPLTGQMPVTMTFHKIDDTLFLDPVSEEEEASEARFTIALSERNKKLVINAVQKGNDTPFSQKELSEIFDIAEKKYKELKEKLEK